jgi:hypothetical protein
MLSSLYVLLPMPAGLSMRKVRTVKMQDAAGILAVDPGLALKVSGINVREKRRIFCGRNGQPGAYKEFHAQ